MRFTTSQKSSPTSGSARIVEKFAIFPEQIWRLNRVIDGNIVRTWVWMGRFYNVEIFNTLDGWYRDGSPYTVEGLLGAASRCSDLEFTSERIKTKIKELEEKRSSAE